MHKKESSRDWALFYIAKVRVFKKFLFYKIQLNSYPLLLQTLFN